MATDTMEHIRMLSHNLRPPALDILDFGEALEAYCREFATRTRIKTEYSAAPVFQVEDTIKISLYRFLQEALTNVAKHAQASYVSVKLTSTEHEISLTVEDNGRGFDSETQAQAQIKRGIGLLGIQERLELLCGRLVIDSKVGQGTRLIAVVPWSMS